MDENRYISSSSLLSASTRVSWTVCWRWRLHFASGYSDVNSIFFVIVECSQDFFFCFWNIQTHFRLFSLMKTNRMNVRRSTTMKSAATKKSSYKFHVGDAFIYRKFHFPILTQVYLLSIKKIYVPNETLFFLSENFMRCGIKIFVVWIWFIRLRSASLPPTLFSKEISTCIMQQ